MKRMLYILMGMLLLSFVSANIISVNCVGDNMNCKKYSFNGNEMNISNGEEHLHFRVITDTTQDIKIKVLGMTAIKTNAYYSRGNLSLKYTCDGWTWNETFPTNYNMSSLEWNYAFNPGCKSVRVSTFIPMIYSWWTGNLEKFDTSDNIQLNYNVSPQGRKFPIVEVTNFANTSKKHCMVIVARQHAGEDYSQWNLYGMFNIIKWAPDKKFLNNVDMLIFPMANPDGQYNGVENNAQGVDLNDNWDSNKSPEVNMIKNYILAFNQTCGGIELYIDMHGDNFGYQRNQSFVHSETNRANTTFFAAMAKYTTYTKKDVYGSVPGQSRYWAKTTFPDALAITTEVVQPLPSYTQPFLRSDGEGLVKALKEYFQIK
jgi:hypothetical protein